MKYTIKWHEYHNPDNWDDEDAEEFNRERAIKNILDSYPYVEHGISKDDGWVEGTCSSPIEAKDLDEAMSKAFDEFECEVFDVFDAKGNLVGNEDGYIVLMCSHCKVKEVKSPFDLCYDCMEAYMEETRQSLRTWEVKNAR